MHKTTNIYNMTVPRIFKRAFCYFYEEVDDKPILCENNISFLELLFSKDICIMCMRLVCHKPV